MRIRIAIFAVLAFAILDLAQGFGLVGDASSAVVATNSLTGDRISVVPAPDGTSDPVASPPATTLLPAPEASTPATTLPSTLPTVTTPTTVQPTPVTKAPPPDAVTARALGSSFEVFNDPRDASPALVLPSRTEFGNPRIMLATQTRDGWVQVMLPVRPNGSLGWVKSTLVALSTVPDVLDVDVDAHTLTWARLGVILMSVKVATGAPSSPTPRGTFYVTDVLPENPDGALGAWVLALDGHSDTFNEFEGGDARIAIHGTDDPSSIGLSASFGCVRVDAASLAQLAASIAPGTPVVIN